MNQRVSVIGVDKRMRMFSGAAGKKNVFQAAGCMSPKTPTALQQRNRKVEKLWI
jgi:hypothetical protein